MLNSVFWVRSLTKPTNNGDVTDWNPEFFNYDVTGVISCVNQALKLAIFVIVSQVGCRHLGIYLLEVKNARLPSGGG